MKNKTFYGMINKIRIQNFKSLKEIELELGQVNLLIGANNSGKTNLLKSLKFFSQNIEEKYNQIDDFQKLKYRKNQNTDEPISFGFLYNKSKHITNHVYFDTFEYVKNNGYIYSKFKLINVQTHLQDFFKNYQFKKDHFFKDFLLFFRSSNVKGNFINFTITEFIDNENSIIIPDDYKLITTKLNSSKVGLFIRGKFPYNNDDNYLLEIDREHRPQHREEILDFEFYEYFKELSIYEPDINKLKIPIPMLESDDSINEDASNLTSFLDNLRDSYPEVIEKIEHDLNKYISNFKGIRFKKITISGDNRTHKILGLIDNYNNVYWADELSEGILFFLTIISIVHQPNPPKLLLLEEPERNIHPRRIKEVVEMIFTLAYEKDIQIIMTTHSPLVLDEFRDYPECVHIFEMNNGETKINNLQNIIDEKNKQSLNNGLKISDYTKNIGDNWVTGFFGGVPYE